jgi:phenylalanyl-tRNA synthetase beta chain
VKISLDWLRDFVTVPVSPQELAARLTSAGLNVEEIIEIDRTFPEVVVGRVVSREGHPDADRLSLCRVDVGGGETLQIVCGASNVREGQHVFLAKVGALLPGDLRIKRAKIRGVESWGMICSEKELGLATESAGIMELEGAPAPGTAADDLIGYRDVVLDVEVTPNRPDWLSHFGVAREVAAIFGTKVTLPRVWAPQQGSGLGWRVEIERYADCPRYTAHGADDIVLRAAPTFMQDRLRAVGQRPINNVVDITNYVMLELGQPLHAFDQERLRGDTIHVRRAGKKQTVITLDGQEREIEADDLVIADSEVPVAVAGVMGLANSQVRTQTRSLLLESAFFSPLLVRRTSRRLGLLSESSYRFEREADWDMVRFAAYRALHLLQEHAGAVVVNESAERADPDRRPPADLPLRVGQANRVLGTDLTVEDAAGLLQRLGLKVQPLGGARGANVVNLMVAVPSFRRDIKQEVDLIEEIARTHGFDRLEGTGHRPRAAAVVRSRLDVVQDRLRRHLASVGFREIVTSTFTSRRDLEALGFAADDPRRECLAVLAASHGGETLLRTSLVPSFVDVARRNLNAGAPAPVRLFQINRVYWPLGERPATVRHEDERLLPEEPLQLQFGCAGDFAADASGLDGDLLEIRGLLDQVAQLLRVTLTVAPGGGQPYLEAGRQWSIRRADGRVVGSAGRLAAAVASRLDLDHPAALAELDLGQLDLQPEPVRYRGFVRYPAVKRDLSLLVPHDVTYAQVSAAVREVAGPLLEELELFDIYVDKRVAASATAYGIRLKFRSADGNLEGKLVDTVLENIVGALSTQLAVRLRS